MEAYYLQQNAWNEEYYTSEISQSHKDKCYIFILSHVKEY